MTYLEMDETDLVSEAAERALMGAVGYHPDAIAAVLAGLPGGDFSNPHRGHVWDACRALSANRDLVEPTRIARQLVSDGLWHSDSPAQRILAGELTNAVPLAVVAGAATEVAELARRRELLRAVKHAHTIVCGKDGDASEVLARVQSVFDEFTAPEREQGGTRSWTQMIAEFEVAHDPDNRRVGITTPWKELDGLIGGLFGGRLYVIGGSAGDGKSTAALNIAHRAARDGQHVLVFSKEMPVVDVFARLVSAPTGVELGQINRRELTEYQRSTVVRASRAANLPLSVNADPVNIAGIKTISRARRHRGQLDLLIVDYLQLIDTGAPVRSQEEEIAKVSTALKQLAMELDIPLVVPAQLNRSPHARSDARPTKADLRGSGRIEQDADVVILLWHPVDGLGKRTGNVVFILDKNRHGPRGEFEHEFNGGYGAIGNIA